MWLVTMFGHDCCCLGDWKSWSFHLPGQVIALLRCCSRTRLPTECHRWESRWKVPDFQIGWEGLHGNTGVQGGGTGKVESFRTILPILGQIDWRKARKMAPINDFITGKVFTDPVFALHALKLIQKLHMWSSAFQTPAFVLGLRAS